MAFFRELMKFSSRQQEHVCEEKEDGTFCFIFADNLIFFVCFCKTRELMSSSKPALVCPVKPVLVCPINAFCFLLIFDHKGALNTHLHSHSRLNRIKVQDSTIQPIMTPTEHSIAFWDIRIDEEISLVHRTVFSSSPVCSKCPWVGSLIFQFSIFTWLPWTLSLIWQVGM